MLDGKSNRPRQRNTGLLTGLHSGGCLGNFAGGKLKSRESGLVLQFENRSGLCALFLRLAKNPRPGIGQIREVLFDDRTAREPLAEADTPKFPTSTAGSLRDADPGWQIFDSSSQEE